MDASKHKIKLHAEQTWHFVINYKMRLSPETGRSGGSSMLWLYGSSPRSDWARPPCVRQDSHQHLSGHDKISLFLLFLSQGIIAQQIKSLF